LGDPNVLAKAAVAPRPTPLKVVDSVSGDAEPPLGVPEGGGGDGGVD
jgi:hypothetical protein